MDIEDNKELLRRFTDEVFNKRNLAAINEFLASDQVDHTLPPNLPPNTAGSTRAIGMYLRAFPDLRLTIDDVVAEGNKVVIRFTSQGTHRGAFGPIPPTGRQVKVSSYLTARIEDGKIVEQWGIDDQIGLLRQLGIFPALFGLAFCAGVGAGVGLAAFWSTRSHAHYKP